MKTGSGSQPPIDHDREKQLADAIATYCDLELEGNVPSLEEFCQGYGDLAAELHASLVTLLSLEGVSPVSKPVSETPASLSGHRIQAEIGSGGMGHVFLAFDERLDRQVAVKMLDDRFWGHPEIRTRFMQEARTLARLAHPNIVRIYHLGESDEPPHFVMEYLEGVPLDAAAQALPLEEKVELVRKVLRAVQFLHDRRIVHRDLKPTNIIVGPDLEPKILDLGLARPRGVPPLSITTPGEVVGTPEYFSPEQARGEEVDPRSDIFSVGTILYRLLTGKLPFEGREYRDQVTKICEEEPVLPRRLNSTVPGELQNICMKALEKDAADRYTSAKEMADDLERFLSGEPVLASPSSYTRRMAGKIDQHLRELEGWRQDRILSDQEFDGLQRNYSRLVEREDAWIMEVRRLSFPQVALYLGAWLLVVGVSLIFLFRYPALSGFAAMLVVAGATIPTGYYGVHCWNSGRSRIAVAYLLAFCLLIPAALLVSMGELKLFTGLTHGRQDLEFLLQFSGFKRTTNAQLWWSLLLSLPAYIWLRRSTRSSVFSLVLAGAVALLCVVTLLRMGMIEWFSENPGWIYLRLMPAAALFFALAIVLEQLKRPADSRYFYPIAIFFTFVSFSGLAGFHEPYAKWLGARFPFTRGQIEYLFIVNAGIYAILQWFCARFPSAQMRKVGHAFRFVIPTHVLTSLLFLGLDATSRYEAAVREPARLHEARAFEVLLPVAALVFVFWSIPKQMKNYLAVGLIFLGVGIIRLQQNWLRDHASWPVTLLVSGVILMIIAARYSSLRTAVSRLLKTRK